MCVLDGWGACGLGSLGGGAGRVGGPISGLSFRGPLGSRIRPPFWVFFNLELGLGVAWSWLAPRIYLL